MNQKTKLGTEYEVLYINSDGREFRSTPTTEFEKAKKEYDSLEGERRFLFIHTNEEINNPGEFNPSEEISNNT